MGQPYVGEIRMFGGSFAPAGWMFTDGQLLPISENETLFNLIGTTFGGDGQSTFALPNLGALTPIHMGAGSGLSTRTLGELGGNQDSTGALQPTQKVSGQGSQANVATAGQMPFLAVNFIISLFGIYPSPT